MYAVIDVELANCSDKGSICSIGVVTVDKGAVVNTFYSLVQPLTAFHPMCVRIHHIKPEHVANAPTFLELWPELWKHLRCCTLVAYRAETDIYSLEKAIFDAAIEPPPLRYACAYRIAKKLLKLDSYKLSAVAQHFGVSQQDAHNALNDALVTANVMIQFEHMVCTHTLNGIMRACCLTYDYIDSNNYNPEEDCCGQVGCYVAPHSLPHGNSRYFENKSVVLTGAFKCATREMVQLTISEMGGICRTKPSKKTNIVIFGFYDMETLLPGCEVGSKLRLAYDLVNDGCDITILDENEFMEILKE